MNCAHLPVTADLARPGIVDHDLARPHGLQDPRVALAQRRQELSHRIGQAVGAHILARQLRRTGEFREPRHLDPLLTWRGRAHRAMPTLIPRSIPWQRRMKAPQAAPGRRRGPRGGSKSDMTDIAGTCATDRWSSVGIRNGSPLGRMTTLCYQCGCVSLRLAHEQRRDQPGRHAQVLPDVPARVFRRDLRDQPVDAAGLPGRSGAGDAAVGDAAADLRVARALGLDHRAGPGAARHGVRGQRRHGDRLGRARRAVPLRRARGRGGRVHELVPVERLDRRCTSPST